MSIYKINIDGYLGVLVSVFVIISSIKLINEVIEPLIGVVPSKEYVDKIKDIILSHKYVLGIHDLVIHNYGNNNNFLSVHIELDSRLSLLDAHDLIDDIENDLKENYDMEVTIHIDPVIIGNKKIDSIKESVLCSLKELNNNITIHDFRIIETKRKIKVLFDCVVPFEEEYTSKYLSNYLKERIDSKKDITFLVEIDRPYC